MEVTVTATSHKTLLLNTLAFTVCFAAWMLNGVLVTFLTSRGIFPWGQVEIGWLLGIPVLTGAIFRFPAGMLADRYGGKPVFVALLLLCAMPMFLLSYVDGFVAFALCSFGFGLTGASFAIGVASTSLWYPRKHQGTALGIFGAGTAGAALTTLLAPTLLLTLTDQGTHLDGWRTLPKLYAAALVVMGIVFLLFATNRKPETATLTVREQLEPLQSVRVWRFGFYYAFLFGGFVALSQWLVPYYVNVYAMSLTSAGLLAAVFSLPAGLVRAAGGWAADRVGARTVLYWTFGLSCVFLLLLIPPRMEIQAPGQGVMADAPGLVEAVSDREVVVGKDRYAVQPPGVGQTEFRVGIHVDDEGFHLMPKASFNQTPVVSVGERVAKGQLLAKGVTRVYFQANRWIFTTLVLMVGVLLGLGSGAVFKHIPAYFPGRVGVVGGVVGVLGGLGGFIHPIVFGYLLTVTGIWTSCWILLAVFALACLAWMHVVVRRMMHARVPALMRDFESPRPA